MRLFIYTYTYTYLLLYINTYKYTYMHIYRQSYRCSIARQKQICTSLRRNLREKIPDGSNPTSLSHLSSGRQGSAPLAKSTPAPPHVSLSLSCSLLTLPPSTAQDIVIYVINPGWESRAKTTARCWDAAGVGSHLLDIDKRGAFESADPLAPGHRGGTGACSAGRGTYPPPPPLLL